MNPLFRKFVLKSMNDPPTAETEAAGVARHYPQQQFVDLPVTAPACFDVINGRGKGIHSHAGNVKYRTLVFLNKVRWYICCNHK